MLRRCLNALAYIFFLFALISCRNEVKDTNASSYETHEKYRPKFHFTPKANWMNDPNGLVFYNEKYHLFYQYYPDSTVWGPMHWGHASSKDLIAWEHHPIALYPDSLGYIFSGSAVIDKNNTAGFGENAMVVMYTYHDPIGDKEGSILFQTQGIAYSNDEGTTFTKYEGNPVILNPGIRDFRDPKAFWNEEKEIWQMALVAKDRVVFYESPDLKSWARLSEFTDNDPDLGVWECPDLFEMKVEGSDESKWILIVSHGTGAPNGGSGTRYFVGEYDGTEFTTENEAKWIDYGTDNYAGVTYNNTPNGERIFIGWMSNWAYAIYTPTDSWRSAMTLPRSLKLTKENADYTLVSEVWKDFSNYRTAVDKAELKGKPPKKFSYEKLQNAQLDIKLNRDSDFKIIISNEKGEKYVVSYSSEENIVLTDRSKSGKTNFRDTFLSPSPQQAPTNNDPISELSMIFDESSVELFINDGKLVITNQLFPTEKFTNFEFVSGSNSINDMKVFKIKKSM